MGFGGSFGGREAEEAGEAAAVVVSDDEEGGGGSGGGPWDIFAGGCAEGVEAGAGLSVRVSVRDGFGGNEGILWIQIDGCSAMSLCSV